MRETAAPFDGRSEPSGRSLAAYGLAAFPLAFLTLPFYVLVPAFYAQAMVLPIALVGQALLLARICDAVSDPLVGALADRTRTRFGRRKVWIAATTPLIIVAAWQVFAPPEGAGIAHLALWSVLLSVSWSALQIPYTAWGAELSRSYAGRNRVTAWREGFTVVGTLAALVLPALLPALGLPGEAVVLRTFALIVAVGLPVAVLVALAGAPKPVDRSITRLAWREAIGHMLANHPFLRLLGAYAVNGLAMACRRPCSCSSFSAGWHRPTRRGRSWCSTSSAAWPAFLSGSPWPAAPASTAPGAWACCSPVLPSPRHPGSDRETWRPSR